MEMTQIIWGSLLLLFAVFTPGYALTLAVFPKMGQIRMAERIGMALIFGFAPSLILYFLTKNLSIPITTTTSILTIGAVTFGSLAIWKRRT